jgi:hypothetical protein
VKKGEDAGESWMGQRIRRKKQYKVIVALDSKNNEIN